jgi:hypothetical protein
MTPAGAALILWGSLVEDTGLTKAEGCSVASNVCVLEERRKEMHENNGHKLARAVSERGPALRRSTIFWDWLNLNPDAALKLSTSADLAHGSCPPRAELHLLVKACVQPATHVHVLSTCIHPHSSQLSSCPGLVFSLNVGIAWRALVRLNGPPSVPHQLNECCC